jgi:hypothetical protein
MSIFGITSSVVGFLGIRIPKGGTSILFKRMEQRQHDLIHKDDENSRGFKFFCSAETSLPYLRPTNLSPSNDFVGISELIIQLNLIKFVFIYALT